METKLINQLDYWKKNDFIKDMNKLKKKVQDEKTGQGCFIFTIKNNSIIKWCAAKPNRRFFSRLECIWKFLINIMKRVTLHDCIISFFFM